MRVFVTGGTGLVGSHTIERLVAEGHDVVALARNDAGADMVRAFGATPAMGSVESPEAWKAAAGADAIIHAAAAIIATASWDRFHREAIDRFLACEYAGEYQKKLLDEFDRALPELPPWK